MQLKGGVIYAAVTKGYDKTPLHHEEPEVRTELRVASDDVNGTLWNREHKIMLPPRERLWSLYLDGSLFPKGPVLEFVESWLATHDMALFRHPHRTCAYSEIDACVARKKITAEQGEKARSHLLLEGFPRDFGLWACGMIARRSHANATQIFLAPAWWGMVQELPRDQIWLPYVVWKIKHSLPRIHTIDADIFENPLFQFRRHGT